jgi:hypothetical protein
MRLLSLLEGMTASKQHAHVLRTTIGGILPAATGPQLHKAGSKQW